MAREIVDMFLQGERTSLGRAPRRPPVGPRHHLAERQRWPWLPTLEHHHLAQHPYCTCCGGVKYVGSHAAMPMGGLVNLAARLRDVLQAQGHKVTEAQFRIVMRRLERQGADDRFTHSRQTQEKLLIDTFAAILGLDPTTVATYARNR